MPNISQAKLDKMIADAASAAATAAVAEHQQQQKEHRNDNRGALWVPTDESKKYLADGDVHPVCTHCGKTSDLRASLYENRRKTDGDKLPDYTVSIYVPKKQTS